MKMGLLEWDTRSAYALTEFVLFAIGVIILALMLVSLGLLFCYFRNSAKYLWVVKALHRFMLRTVFSNSSDFVEILYPKEKSEPSPPKPQSNLGKIAVYIYFTLLSGLVALWYLAVFSDSFFYRKTGTCNDLNANDTDYSCFLLSDRNVPPQVQEIIDEEDGQLVPCQRVQNFLRNSNVTYNLEVLCYSTQPNPFLALGVAYGASKSIVFLLQVIFKIFLFLAGRGRYVKRCLVAMQISFLATVLLFVVVIPAVLHGVSGPRNTPIDIFRGERFYPYASIFLMGLSTIIVVGLTPWWAFKPIGWKQLFCCWQTTVIIEQEQESEERSNEVYHEMDQDGEKEQELSSPIE